MLRLKCVILGSGPYNYGRSWQNEGLEGKAGGSKKNLYPVLQEHWCGQTSQRLQGNLRSQAHPATEVVLQRGERGEDYAKLQLLCSHLACGSQPSVWQTLSCRTSNWSYRTSSWEEKLNAQQKRARASWNPSVTSMSVCQSVHLVVKTSQSNSLPSLPHPKVSHKFFLANLNLEP